MLQLQVEVHVSQLSTVLNRLRDNDKDYISEDSDPTSAVQKCYLKIEFIWLPHKNNTKFIIIFFL